MTKPFDRAQNKKIKYISEESEDSKTQTKKLKDKLKQCQKDKEEYLTQAQRARADLVNYRRRQEEKMIPEFIAMGQVSIIHKILPVLDSLEAGAESNKDIEQIRNQIKKALKDINTEEIKAIGERFNPEFHEAIELVESDQESGIIIQEVQKGYLLNNKVLRTSKVKVAK
ncbi:nucleotide exchange factor GrpE [Patescibacteria group bacterium]|nr:nucleotide exchange factor GrpE [Patescibacteria group bacterium]MBU1563805.1 nucleotide exchange factor GrpE [Patescibacteria group bacterium]MBU2068191.1 nucleotide exchange factor GrpE [Patescibacteria group bacterium]